MAVALALPATGQQRAHRGGLGAGAEAAGGGFGSADVVETKGRKLDPVKT